MSSDCAVDPLVQTIIERCAQLSHRSLIVLRGAEATEKVVILKHLVYKANKYGSEQLPVLWCHKKDAQLAKSNRKTLKSLDRLMKSGKMDLEQLQPLDLLLHSAAVRFCSYNDSHNTLGNTYGMCVLQDVECLTPNLLCRVVETVQGGGAVVLLLPGMSHLRQLRELNMDIHYRLTTHSHPVASKLFNNRLLVSLSWCSTAVVLDSNLQVCLDVEGLQYCPSEQLLASQLQEQQKVQEELKKLQQTMKDGVKPLPQMLRLCKTHDQGQAVTKLLEVISARRAGDVVSLTAGRGRGKSAALGLAVAAAVSLGLSNIFVTSPSPHNLTAFFQFMFTGFDALEYKEGSDYEIFQSNSSEFGGTVVRVVVSRNQRQTVQYLLPEEHAMLQHAELVVIDEAAAIPLPQVQALLGPHTTLMASTISGYEGTGRGLSLKLLKQLRQQSAVAPEKISGDSKEGQVHELHEVTMSSSIRYASGDPVEDWLYRLLCLDATPSPATHFPAPASCDLYYVNKDVLLSGNKWSELFLAQVQGLLVSSHYRNSPDDLQVLADAPAHHLFVLLPSLPAVDIRELPTVLCVLQVCLEGGIDPAVSRRVLRAGERPSGDLVPWNLATQFLNAELTQHVGARVIRAAAHPDYQGMGYGTRALKQLQDYYSGRLLQSDGIKTAAPQERKPHPWPQDEQGPVGPQQEQGPLLCSLTQHSPPTVAYLSSAFGITAPLFKFWARAGFLPLYVGQVVNKTTGEHSCTMLYPVQQQDSDSIPSWLLLPCQEFVLRIEELLSGPLRGLPPSLAHDLIKAHNNSIPTPARARWRDVECELGGHNLRKLEAYSKHDGDRHLVTDLLPYIAHLYCSQQLPDLNLPFAQAALLVGCGLQHKEVVAVGAELQLNPESTLGNFKRAIRRVYHVLVALLEEEQRQHAGRVPVVAPHELASVDSSVNQDLKRKDKTPDRQRPGLHKRQHDSQTHHQSTTIKLKKENYTHPN